MGTGLEIALLGTAIGLSGASVVAGEKSRKQQKRAARVQERVRQTQDSRQRIAQVRQARMAQAQVTQSGATQGALNSSAVQGGISAIGSNMENNIQFINQIDTLQQAIARRMNKANDWAGTASALGGLASIAGSAASMTSPTKPSQAGAPPKLQQRANGQNAFWNNAMGGS